MDVQQTIAYVFHRWQLMILHYHSKSINNTANVFFYQSILVYIPVGLVGRCYCIQQFLCLFKLTFLWPPFPLFFKNSFKTLRTTLVTRMSCLFWPNFVTSDQSQKSSQCPRPGHLSKGCGWGWIKLRQKNLLWYLEIRTRNSNLSHGYSFEREEGQIEAFSFHMD